MLELTATFSCFVVPATPLSARSVPSDRFNRPEALRRCLSTGLLRWHELEHRTSARAIVSILLRKALIGMSPQRRCVVIACELLGRGARKFAVARECGVCCAVPGCSRV